MVLTRTFAPAPRSRASRITGSRHEGCDAVYTVCAIGGPEDCPDGPTAAAVKNESETPPF